MLGTAPVGSGTGVATLPLSTLRAGRHTIAATYLGDSNLAASTSTPVTIVVSQKTGPSGEPYLIVTANDTSRIYGQANPAFTFTVSGTLLNGDTPATAVTGVPIYSTPSSLGSPAGTYPVSITGGLSSLNYLMEFQDGTITVTPTTLTVALASSPNPVTYGSAVTFHGYPPDRCNGHGNLQRRHDGSRYGKHQWWSRYPADQLAYSGHTFDHGAVWRGYQLQRRCLNGVIPGGE